ncbi:hypothetical protein Pmani_018035 [Petrolisthes manimaculis]|uniref:SH2 domain-containing protein n=1 Tax=Petrolisthes manimaculis TaxID=1843537 RepID=A0AAE1U973_9EUCA|nr:hypothetical protein Pmani_018035 [Petrolisthes manimaculis]
MNRSGNTCIHWTTNLATLCPSLDEEVTCSRLQNLPELWVRCRAEEKARMEGEDSLTKPIPSTLASEASVDSGVASVQSLDNVLLLQSNNILTDTTQHSALRRRTGSSVSSGTSEMPLPNPTTTTITTNNDERHMSLTTDPNTTDPNTTDPNTTTTDPNTTDAHNTNDPNTTTDPNTIADHNTNDPNTTADPNTNTDPNTTTHNTTADPNTIADPNTTDDPNTTTDPKEASSSVIPFHPRNLRADEADDIPSSPPPLHNPTPTNTAVTVSRSPAVVTNRALPPLPSASEATDHDEASRSSEAEGTTERREEEGCDFASIIEKVKDCGWYWGPISGEAAEKVLANEPDGSFIVRDSSDHHYIFSLTFKLNGFIRHVRIEHDQGNFSFGGFTKFKSQTIVEFIENAVEHSRSGRYLFFLHRRPVLGPMRVQLLHPVSRFKHIQSLQHLCR